MYIKYKISTKRRLLFYESAGHTFIPFYLGVNFPSRKISRLEAPRWGIFLIIFYSSESAYLSVGDFHRIPKINTQRLNEDAGARGRFECEISAKSATRYTYLCMYVHTDIPIYCASFWIRITSTPGHRSQRTCLIKRGVVSYDSECVAKFCNAETLHETSVGRPFPERLSLFREANIVRYFLPWENS